MRWATSIVSERLFYNQFNYIVRIMFCKEQRRFTSGQFNITKILINWLIAASFCALSRPLLLSFFYDSKKTIGGASALSINLLECMKQEMSNVITNYTSQPVEQIEERGESNFLLMWHFWKIMKKPWCKTIDS